MDTGWVQVVFPFVLVLVLIVTGLPVAFGLGATGILFTLYTAGPDKLISIAVTTWTCMNNWSISACLLFFLMAYILQQSGIVEELFETASKWLGFLPGGLAISVVLVCAVLAAMSGVAAAGVVLMGLLTIPAMMKRGYDKGIAIGCVAAGGPLGVLIPPSVYFIFFGAFTGTSIGALFIAGIGPGLLLTLLFCAYIATRCLLDRTLGPPIPDDQRGTWSEKWKTLKAVVFPGFLVLLVLGTIYTGICTPTEAAAMGAVGAIACSAAKRKLTWKVVKTSIRGALILNGMTMWLYFCGSIFSQSVTSAGVVNELIRGITATGLGPWGVLIMIQITWIILGMFIDAICVVLISMPFFFPLAVKMGFDPILIGALFVLNSQIGFISPPFGFSLFYLKSVVPKGVTFGDIVVASFPFLVLQVMGLAILMMFPAIALWLPGLMR